MAVAKNQNQYQVIGTRPIRHDGVDKVTGRARFGADTKLSGLLHASVLGSPHPHAKINAIDTSKAEALDGVRAVITSADFPEPGDYRLRIFAKRGRAARYFDWALDYKVKVIE